MTARNLKSSRAGKPPAKSEAVAVDRDSVDEGPVNSDESISWRGWICLICGWILPQLVLIGPALVERQILLPFDLLASPNVYLPKSEKNQRIRPVNYVLSDLILVDKPARDFCLQEFRAGRLPVWQPQNYLGAPFTSWPKYSPFEIPCWLNPHPSALAWSRLLQVLCLATGGWCFLRWSLGLSYWPSAIGSWCLPLIGFFVLWQGYPLTGCIAWLGWLLVAVDITARRPGGYGPLGLVAVTALLILSGQPDVAGLVLITSGFYAISRLIVEWGRDWRLLLPSLTALSLAWMLGILLASIYWEPFLSYARTGVRWSQRLQGKEERPPVGWSALLTALSPEALGNTRQGSYYLRTTSNLLESSAGAYAGLVAALWLVPLAFCNRLRRSQAITWAAIGIFGIAWPLGLPGLTHLMRLPLLNSFSYNRAVFMTAFAVIVLASIGLDQILSGKLQFRIWFLFPMSLCLIGAIGFLAVSIQLPRAISVDLPDAVNQGLKPRITLNDVPIIQRSFIYCYLQSAALATMALAGWIWVSTGLRYRRAALAIIAAVMVGELFVQGVKESRLRDWQADFPRIPALQKIAERLDGRIWGVVCLPPNLNRSHGLSDVRGYDAVDPELAVQLLLRAADSEHQSPSYAKTLEMVPGLLPEGKSVRIHPIANLLNVRYFITRSAVPLPLPIAAHEDDYWVFGNTQALPRAYVPRQTQTVPASAVLDQLSRGDFDPRQVAYVTQELNLPTDCRGSVVLIDRSPIEIKIQAEMETDGLIVVSDMWDADWYATIDGQPTSILKVDSALRGIVASAGKHQILMNYRSAAVQKGLLWSFSALVVWLIWVAGLTVIRWLKNAPSNPVTAEPMPGGQ